MATKNKVESAQEKIARIEAELAAAKAEAAAEVEARNEEIATKVRSLTKMFNVATLADVISLVKSVDKGTLGKLDASASRSYVRLTPEQKATIRERRAKGGSGNQVSELATEFNVSVGTIYNVEKGKDEAAPAPAASEAVAAS